MKKLILLKKISVTSISQENGECHAWQGHGGREGEGGILIVSGGRISSEGEAKVKTFIGVSEGHAMQGRVNCLGLNSVNNIDGFWNIWMVPGPGLI